MDTKIVRLGPICSTSETFKSLTSKLEDGENKINEND